MLGYTFFTLLYIFQIGTIADGSLCDGKPCQLQGQCGEYLGSMLRVCICIKGYSLDNNGNCVDIDECAVNHHDPCGHRGQCANTIGGYTCSCLQGWSNDSLCSKNVSDPALCMPGYTGNRCSDATCGQHGYAQPIGLNDFRCICNGGWTQNSLDVHSPCETDINECLNSTTCVDRGNCVNEPGSFRCECLSGWYGNKCEYGVWNCTFDNDNLCNWTNVNGGDDTLNWNLIHSTTPTDDTGPSNDHTTGNIDGAYIFMESSAPTVQGDNAMLRSPEINTTGSRGICLNFWYSMNGDSIGSLKVYIEEAGTRRLIWSLSGHQGTEWRNASVPVHSNQNVHIILEATVGDGYLGDIALDDISMTRGPCTLEPSIARPISPNIVG